MHGKFLFGDTTRWRKRESKRIPGPARAGTAHAVVVPHVRPRYAPSKPK